MWLLDPGLRWLRPSKEYIIGRSRRTTANEFINLADDPYVSHNHLNIKVQAVAEGASADVGYAPPLSITDLESSRGTFVDTKKLTPNEPLKVTKAATKLTLGKTTLTLVWKPIIITFSSGEHGEAHESLYQSVRQKLEPLGIKIVLEFVPGTTHFMKGTRLTSKLMQALAENLPILTVHSADAIIQETDSFELDFSLFPSTFMDTPESWQPNPKRKRCLERYTFVFVSESQLYNLEKPIKAAGGACLFKSVDEVTSPDLVIVPEDPGLLHKLESLGRVQLVDQRDLLDAVVDLKPVSPRAIGQEKRKVAPVNMLGFMANNHLKTPRTSRRCQIHDKMGETYPGSLTEVTEPTKTEPTKETEPTKQTNHTEVTQPTQPIKQTEPTQASQPSEPTEPIPEPISEIIPVRGNVPQWSQVTQAGSKNFKAFKRKGYTPTQPKIKLVEADLPVPSKAKVAKVASRAAKVTNAANVASESEGEEDEFSFHFTSV